MEHVDEAYFGSWMDEYGKAWVDGDPDAVMALFAQDAVYDETPFENHMVGKDEIYRYWTEGAQESQRDVTFDYRIICVKDNTGYTFWTASFIRVPSNALVELDAIMAIMFDGDGKCIQLREWWHKRETEA